MHRRTARGHLIGGNLTLISATIGTPFEPDFRGALLFLEDNGEAPRHAVYPRSDDRTCERSDSGPDRR